VVLGTTSNKKKYNGNTKFASTWLSWLSGLSHQPNQILNQIKFSLYFLFYLQLDWENVDIFVIIGLFVFDCETQFNEKLI
jgi:hypothetical protein